MRKLTENGAGRIMKLNHIQVFAAAFVVSLSALLGPSLARNECTHMDRSRTYDCIQPLEETEQTDSAGLQKLWYFQNKCDYPISVWVYLLKSGSQVKDTFEVTNKNPFPAKCYKDKKCTGFGTWGENCDSNSVGKTSSPSQRPSSFQSRSAGGGNNDQACKQTCIDMCTSRYSVTDPKFPGCTSLCACSNGQLREPNPYLK